MGSVHRVGEYRNFLSAGVADQQSFTWPALPDAAYFPTHPTEIYSAQACPTRAGSYRMALTQMNGVIDVSEEDLVEIYELAIKHVRNHDGKVNA